MARALRVIGAQVNIAGLATPWFGVARASGPGVVDECRAVVHAPSRRGGDGDWLRPRVRVPAAGAAQANTGSSRIHNTVLALPLVT